MQNTNPKNVSKSSVQVEKAKSGLKSSGTSSNVKTGKVLEEQKMKRSDASWKK